VHGAPPAPITPPTPPVASLSGGAAGPASLFKSTEMRTVDPRTGPTFPAAAAGPAPPPPPARVNTTTPVFGSVQLTPIPSTGSQPPPPPAPQPSPSNPPPPNLAGLSAHVPPLPPMAPAPPIPGAPAASPMPSVAAMSALPGLPSRGEVPVSRASRTVADGALRAPPSLAVGRTPRPLAGFLVSFQYEPLGTFWPLATGSNRIGRANARPDVDVAIADATISSDQAELTIERGAASIEDRGSTNRTFVNGHPLVAGQRAAVRHGDRLRFGSYEAILVLLP
jgi:hypothetical protein